MTPIEYIKEINENYWPAFKAKLSRMDIVWGKWSRQMNIRLRAEIAFAEQEGDNLLHQKLVDVFMFWQIRSQTLDLNHKNGILNKSKMKKKNKQAQKLFKFIRDGKTVRDRTLDDVAKHLM